MSNVFGSSRARRGQTESYSFLIGLIVMSLILGVVVISLYNYYGYNPLSECIERMIKASESMKNENSAAGPIVCDLDRENLIAGFGKEEKNITLFRWEKAFSEGTKSVSTDIFVRPDKCPPDNSCLCACSSTKKQGSRIYCLGNYKCEPVLFENIFGSKIAGGRQAASSQNFIVSGVDGAVPFYMDRRTNDLEICAFENCRIGVRNQSREVFDKLIKAYYACANSSEDSCYCPVDISSMNLTRGAVQGDFIFFFLDRGGSSDTKSKSSLKAMLVYGYPGFIESVKKSREVFEWTIDKSSDLPGSELCVYGLFKGSIVDVPFNHVFLVEGPMVEDGKISFFKLKDKVCLAKAGASFEWLEEYPVCAHYKNSHDLEGRYKEDKGEEINNSFVPKPLF